MPIHKKASSTTESSGPASPWSTQRTPRATWGGDQRLGQFADGADLLIHDAQFTEAEYLDTESSKQGWGHSTPQMAASVARRANVHTLVLYHHDPSHDDNMVMAMEREARNLFPSTYAAYEGLTFDLHNMPDASTTP